MRDGWREVEITNGHMIRTCGGCFWRQKKLVRSGKNPIYKDICLHPDLDPKNSTSTRYVSPELNTGIYGYAEPSKYCPYTPQLEREIKINKII